VGTLPHPPSEPGENRRNVSTESAGRKPRDNAEISEFKALQLTWAILKMAHNQKNQRTSPLFSIRVFLEFKVPVLFSKVNSFRFSVERLNTFETLSMRRVHTPSKKSWRC
jgi:hypothetical protein